MCGFAGIVTWSDAYRIERDTLAKMSARIAHRGPDGEGTCLNHEQPATPQRPQVGLVHRRLAIIDPDPRANQPFTDHAGRSLVFNGEIYNFRALRTELKSLAPEYEWRTDCDTEVLLLAYDVWSRNCVEHLEGMFAFAVWDEPKGELFLARDRMGQKPLYVAVAPHDSSKVSAVAFASELGALRELAWFDMALNENALHDYLRHGYVGGERTVFARTGKLAPGTWRQFSASAPPVEARYFDPNEKAPGDADPAARTRTLLAQAVRRQLVSDVPLGCFLSGGVDSSVIAAAMKVSVPAGQPVLTFSIGFEDARYDETAFAASIAAHLGTQHRQFIVRPDAAEDLPRLAAVFGEPFADSSALPTHYLARETRQHVKVALSGDGGDELFGGYERYRAMAIAAQFRHLPGPLRAMITARLWQGLPGVHPKSRLTRLKRLLATLAQPPAERYAGYLRLFDDATIGRLLVAHAGAREPDPLIEQFRTLEKTRDVVESALATDRRSYLPDDLLTKVDRASMLHALEVRSPFMDHELVRFAAGLATDQLLKGGPKRMLRDAFAPDLPAWVFKRKKMGFAVPIGEWLRGSLRPMLHDHLFAANAFASTHFQMKTVRRLVDEHEQQKVDHAQRLYALLMLELWWQNQRT